MTTAFATFPVTKVLESKLKYTSFDKLVFGKDFPIICSKRTTEMANGQILKLSRSVRFPFCLLWLPCITVRPFLKALKPISMLMQRFYFRPYDNFKRFNISAKRMQMPEVPEEIFMDGMKQLIELDKDWIPAKRIILYTSVRFCLPLKKLLACVLPTAINL